MPYEQDGRGPGSSITTPWIHPIKPRDSHMHQDQGEEP